MLAAPSKRKIFRSGPCVTLPKAGAPADLPAGASHSAIGLSRIDGRRNACEYSMSAFALFRAACICAIRASCVRDMFSAFTCCIYDCPRDAMFPSASGMSYLEGVTAGPVPIGREYLPACSNALGVSSRGLPVAVGRYDIKLSLGVAPVAATCCLATCAGTGDHCAFSHPFGTGSAVVYGGLPASIPCAR